MREYKDQVLPLEPRVADACKGRLEPGSEEWQAWRRARAIALEGDEDDSDDEREGEDDEHEVRTDEGAQVDDGAVKIAGEDDDEGDAARKALREQVEGSQEPKTPGGRSYSTDKLPLKRKFDDMIVGTPLDMDDELPMTVEEAMDKWGHGEDGDDLRILIKVCLRVADLYAAHLQPSGKVTQLRYRSIF